MWITANFQDNREDIMNICVYGAASARLEEIYYKKTQELGALMGKQGHGLVFGGGATGNDGSSRKRRAFRKRIYFGDCSQVFRSAGSSV